MIQNGFIFPNFRDENNKHLSCHHLGLTFEHAGKPPMVATSIRIPCSLHPECPRSGVDGPRQSHLPCVVPGIDVRQRSGCVRFASRRHVVDVPFALGVRIKSREC